MELQVREMRLDEVDVIIDYFHGATAEHLELLCATLKALGSHSRRSSRKASK